MITLPSQTWRYRGRTYRTALVVDGDRVVGTTKVTVDRGLVLLRPGDRAAALTKAAGIKPCGGCKKRQRWLNRLELRIRRFFSR